MSSQIKYITPRLLNGKHIESWFTLANSELIHKNQKIAGLNLGHNTQENAEIVKQNRGLLLKDLDLNPKNVVFGIQIHKTDVKVVKEGGTYAGTDAFVTSSPGLALAIQVADCAAVLLGDDENKVIGAAHAGWRGAVMDIIPKTVSKMLRLGARKENIKVYVSPCISVEKFEVGEEVAEEFPPEYVDYDSFEKAHVDLKGFLRHQMTEAGISLANIEIDAGCTVSDHNYYSYRRQQKKSGRMMGIIRLKK